jgi:hypothetical protein
MPGSTPGLATAIMAAYRATTYLLSPAARTSRLMAVAIGRIEVRLALNGFASRVAS